MAKSGVTANKGSLRVAAKTTSNRLHIIPTLAGWSVRREGALRASGNYRTKLEALQGAKKLKSKTSIVVHRKDGTIERWTKLA